jgi:hypothetical protein
MYTLFAVLIRYESTKVLSYESTKVQYEGTFESTFVLSKYVVLSYVLRKYNYLRRYFRTFVLSYFRTFVEYNVVLSYFQSTFVLCTTTLLFRTKVHSKVHVHVYSTCSPTIHKKVLSYESITVIILFP